MRHLGAEVCATSYLAATSRDLPSGNELPHSMFSRPRSGRQSCLVMEIRAQKFCRRILRKL